MKEGSKKPIQSDVTTSQVDLEESWRSRISPYLAKDRLPVVKMGASLGLYLAKEWWLNALAVGGGYALATRPELQPVQEFIKNHPMESIGTSYVIYALAAARSVYADIQLQNATGISTSVLGNMATRGIEYAQKRVPGMENVDAGRMGNIIGNTVEIVGAEIPYIAGSLYLGSFTDGGPYAAWVGANLGGTLAFMTRDYAQNALRYTRGLGSLARNGVSGVRDAISRINISS